METEAIVRLTSAMAIPKKKKKIKENNQPHQRLCMKPERAFSTCHISHTSSLILSLDQPLAATDDHSLPYLELSAPIRVASPTPPPLEAADLAGPSHSLLDTASDCSSHHFFQSSESTKVI